MMKKMSRFIPSKKEDTAKLLLRLPMTLNEKIEYVKRQTKRSKNEIVVTILKTALETVEAPQEESKQESI